MQKLSRREALRGTGVAALAAGAAVVPIVGARAAVLDRRGEDATDTELRHLWADWVDVWTSLQAAAIKERPLRVAVYQEKKRLKPVYFLDRISALDARAWRWVAVERLHPFSTTRSRKLWRTRVIPGALPYEEAHNFAKTRLETEMEAYRQRVAAIRARHGLDVSEAKSELLRNRLTELRQTIKRVPATTIFGVGVRMAVVQGGRWDDDHFEQFYCTLETVGKLSGTQFRLPVMQGL